MSWKLVLAWPGGIRELSASFHSTKTSSLVVSAWRKVPKHLFVRSSVVFSVSRNIRSLNMTSAMLPFADWVNCSILSFRWARP